MAALASIRPPATVRNGRLAVVDGQLLHKRHAAAVSFGKGK